MQLAGAPGSHKTPSPTAVRLPAGARLRTVSERDASTIATIAGLLGETGDVQYWREKLAQLAASRGSGLGVDVDGRLVAYMLGHVRGGEFGLAEDTAFIEFLGVDPTWQGKGVARALAESAIEQLAQQGVRRVLTLVSAADDRLLPFFRALGFRPAQLQCLERRL